MRDLEAEDLKARCDALDPSRSFIVQAPAGSGKTELLTQRYLVLLSVVPFAPEQILAVTFTRKAQSEMRQRIIDALIQAMGPAPLQAHARKTWELAQKVLEQNEKKGWDLLNHPNRLKVMTIDALSHHFVHRLPVLSHFGGSPEVDSNPDLLYEAAIDAFLEEVQTDPELGQALKDLLFHLDNYLERLQRLLMQLLKKREQWLHHIVPCANDPSKGIEALEKGLKRMIEHALSEANDALEGHGEEIEALAAHAAETLLESEPEHPLVLSQQHGLLPQPTLEALKHWQALGHWMLTDKKEARKRVTYEQGFLAPSKGRNKAEKEHLSQLKGRFTELLANLDGEQQAALANVMDFPLELYSDQQKKVLRSLFVLLPRLVAHLKVLFRKEGKVDFIEVNEGASIALGTEDAPTDLSLALDFQIHHILIDEFQDTSLIQYNLFKKLVSGWQQDDQKSIFLVGDPQQSIYRFRGAEVGVFLQTLEHGLPPLVLDFLQLRKNFRSEVGICDWINSSFKPLFPSHSDIGLGAVPYSESVAVHPNTLDASVLNCGFKDEVSQALYLATLLQKKEHEGTVAVLVRSRNHLTQIIKVFRALHIPYVAHEIESLRVSRVLRDLLSLLQALRSFTARIAWLALLRAPWCGLSLSDLWILAHDSEQPILWKCLNDSDRVEKLSAEGQLKLKRVVALLQVFFRHRLRAPLCSSLRALWYQLGGPACYNADELKDAEKLFQRLEQVGSIETWEFFEKDILSKYSEPDAMDPDIGAVELMTIHKSKGLEFDTVILPSLERRSRAPDPELLLFQEFPYSDGVDLLMAPAKSMEESEDKLYHYLQSVMNQKARLESVRLLYVAATRAKKKLLLCSVVSFKEDEPLPPKPESFMGMLAPFISEPVMQEDKMDFYESSKSLVQLQSTWKLPAEIEVCDVPLDLTAALNHPQRREQSVEMAIGTLVHRILEGIVQQPFSSDTIRQRQASWRQALMELGVKTSQVEDALQAVSRCIERTLGCPKGQWIIAGHQEGGAELRLITPQLNTYVIDRTFVDAQGIRWIIDYKVVLDAEPDPLLYSEQIEHYTKLMRAMDKRPIRCALYFPYTAYWWEHEEVRFVQ